ncbi:hypothetical protein E2C01_002626 [Portunus trituberculatus]|uniref:Uncharacterized protein n=1 Tax=Portunus trituberculatus TaxID=210409 RepID=A0A5B7CMI0_PORTR|nr:hypothetical protein [Portunus trituberculatus]
MSVYPDPRKLLGTYDVTGESSPCSSVPRIYIGSSPSSAVTHPIQTTVWPVVSLPCGVVTRGRTPPQKSFYTSEEEGQEEV